MKIPPGNEQSKPCHELTEWEKKGETGKEEIATKSQIGFDGIGSG